MRFAALLLAASAGACATPSPVAPPAPAPAPLPVAAADAAPRAALLAFVADLEAGRFDAACARLSARWRARYTPARLAADFAAAGPLGRDAAARARALAANAFILQGDRAVLAVGQGKQALLVREGQDWRVDRLE